METIIYKINTIFAMDKDEWDTKEDAGNECIIYKHNGMAKAPLNMITNCDVIINNCLKAYNKIGSLFVISANQIKNHVIWCA